MKSRIKTGFNLFECANIFCRLTALPPVNRRANYFFPGGKLPAKTVVYKA